MDAGQGQDLNQVDLNNSQLQQVQAGRDSIAAQNSQVMIKNSIISLFGDRPVAAGVDWDWAGKVLEGQLTQIQQRLTDVLLENQLFSIDAEEWLELVGRSPLTSVQQLKVGQKIETLDPDQMLIEVFGRKDIGGKLLILGRPGAGKTTTLLRLAQQLVSGALENPKRVIPVIFELSAWKDDGQSIHDFLIEQLYDNIGGNRKSRIYETWLEQRVLLPLLDGLDELGMERQQKCTEKLNEFAKTYPQVVVCCRVWEFAYVGIDLDQLNGAIVLQPLSDQQIQDYLGTVKRSGLWEQIVNTPEMAKMLEPDDEGEPGLLRVPLFISLAAAIYDGEQAFRSKGELLENYIERQLSFEVRKSDRRRKEFVGRIWVFKTMEREPDSEDVKSYLKWFSDKLLDAQITDFQVKFLTHDWMRNIHFEDRKSRPRPIPITWLDSKAQKTLCLFLSFILMPILIILGNSLYLDFLKDIILAILSTTIGFSLTLMLSMLISYTFILVISYIFISMKSFFSRFSWVSKTTFLFRDFIKSKDRFCRNLSCKIKDYIFYTKSIFIWFLVFTFCLVFFLFPLGTFLDQYLMPIYAEILVYSSGFISNFLPISSLIGWLGGSTMGIVLGLVLSPILFKDMTNDNTNPVANNGRSKDSLPPFSSFILVLFYVHMMYGLGLYIFHKSGATISFQTIVPVLPSGIVFILYLINTEISNGYLGQLPIRLILFRQGKIPWNYARFLNYCAERRLLQRIGDRYRFIHREVRDHFGKLEG